MDSSANSITTVPREVSKYVVYFSPLQKILVRLEGSPGTCCCNDSYAERLPLLGRRVTGSGGFAAGGGVGTETGKSDDAAAAADIYAADGRIPGSQISCASWAGSRGRFLPRAVGIRAASGAAFGGAGSVASHGASRPVSASDAGATAAAAQALAYRRPKETSRAILCLPVGGSPTFEPGWLEITAPALVPLPPLVAGLSPPLHRRVRRVLRLCVPSPILWGWSHRQPKGAVERHYLRAAFRRERLRRLRYCPCRRRDQRALAEEERLRGCRDKARLRCRVCRCRQQHPQMAEEQPHVCPSDAPEPLRLPRGLPLVPLGVDGRWWRDDVARERAVPAPLFALPAFTDGGGGTTSVAPNIFPIKLLMKVPLPDCDGGGGTTVFRRILYAAAGQTAHVGRDVGGRRRSDDRR